jgi:hypothetical protein
MIFGMESGFARMGMGRAFSPHGNGDALSWGVAPGWHEAAPLALNSEALQQSGQFQLRLIAGLGSSGTPPGCNPFPGQIRGCRWRLTPGYGLATLRVGGGGRRWPG